MEEIFYGAWNLVVSQKKDTFFERFRIIGSDASDGIYPAISGLTIPQVSGNGWKIVLEWNKGIITIWHLNNIHKIAQYSVEDGLIVMLSSDANFDTLSFPNFHFLVITMKCLDPELNPLHPLGNSYDFTVPRKSENHGNTSRHQPPHTWKHKLIK